ncbi:MAG TPA: fibronectin type III domain-containing protein, partial [Nitrospiraceae bacterium]|nr:fibronectin type III domain-containing protein [Nitrospiraceae bacterium]
ATGSHTGSVTLSGGTGVTPVTIPVTFTIAAAPVPPAIGASPTTLSFTATQGGANPANQIVTINNTGGGTLAWSASENASWLTLNPASGTGNGTLTATVNTAGLATGPHTSTITVAASGATSQIVSVTLTVNAPATSSASLTWNANTESDLAGYKVYRKIGTGAYGAPIFTVIGNTTNYVATGLQIGTTYSFVVTAYDNAGNESIVSNEVSKSIF